MKFLVEQKYIVVRLKTEDTKDPLPGYPLYPASQDIYSQCKEETEINPEELEYIKNSDINHSFENENSVDYDGYITRNELNLPDSEIDEVQADNEANNVEDNYNGFDETENSVKYKNL